jgi:hypothetical protein
MHSVGHIRSRPGEGGTEAPGSSFRRILAGRYCVIPDDAPLSLLGTPILLPLARRSPVRQLSGAPCRKPLNHDFLSG